MNLELLFWLIILLFPLLSHLFRKKPPTRTPQEEAPDPEPWVPRERRPRREEEPADYSLEAALREIREALGEAVEEPRQHRPQPRPQPSTPIETSADLTTRPVEAREQVPVRPEIPPTALEKATPRQRRTLKSDTIKVPPPPAKRKVPDLQRPSSIKAAAVAEEQTRQQEQRKRKEKITPEARSAMLAHLRLKSVLREAIVMREILGPPRSRPGGRTL